MILRNTIGERHTYEMKLRKDVTYFARINFRRDNRLFGIKQADRLMHTYMIGKTGTGKTTCIETQVMQDIHAGRGLCLLDPHGDLVEKVYKSIPETRRQDVIYFNIPDQDLNLRYNPLKLVTYEKRSLIAAGMLQIFEKLWGNKAWGVRLEHILRFTLLTLLDQPTSTLSDVSQILLSESFRNRAFEHIVNPDVRTFWTREFPHYMRYDILPVLNKIGGMLAHPVVKRVLIENTEEVSLRKAMDDKKIVLVNLSKGHLGEDVANILGGLLVTALGSAAFSRVDTLETKRVPFMIYADEFHNFTTLALVNMMSELRKFKVGMTVAHQYMHQLDDEIKWAILGNVGTIISFRVGTDDAYHMAREMYPKFDVEDFINMKNYDIYLKLMIDGKPSKPFSASTFRTLHVSDFTLALCANTGPQACSIVRPEDYRSSS